MSSADLKPSTNSSRSESVNLLKSTSMLSSF
nr:MAG TPA: hypothetical protein [Caudoviricetes sp.]